MKLPGLCTLLEFLLVPVFLIGGLMELASAQHRYVFPQFAFGGGWESTLMVWPDNRASVGSTTCTFSAQGRFLTMRDDQNNIHTGTEITVASRLGPGGGLFDERGKGVFNLLKTETPAPRQASSLFPFPSLFPGYDRTLLETPMGSQHSQEVRASAPTL